MAHTTANNSLLQPAPQPTAPEQPERMTEPLGPEMLPLPEMPLRFGAWLARAREARGLTLDDVAHETKIRRAILDALERDARRELPEKVFVLGYVRSYAHVVGLNVEEAVRRLQESWPADGAQEGEGEQQRKARSLAWLPPVVAALVLLAVFWFIVQMLSSSP